MDNKGVRGRATLLPMSHGFGCQRAAVLGRVCKVPTLKPEPVRLARTAETNDLMDGSKLQEEQTDGKVPFERYAWRAGLRAGGAPEKMDKIAKTVLSVPCCRSLLCCRVGRPPLPVWPVNACNRHFMGRLSCPKASSLQILIP